jgi:hypothetical protein
MSYASPSVDAPISCAQRKVFRAPVEGANSSSHGLLTGNI